MFCSDDPIHDFMMHDADQEDQLAKLPRCSECDEPIQDDYCYVINDEIICEECMKSNYRRCTDDLFVW